MSYILALLIAFVTFFPEYGDTIYPIIVVIMGFFATVFYYTVFKLFTGLNRSSLNVEDHNIINWQISLVYVFSTFIIYMQYSPLIAGILIPMAVISVVTNILTELIKREILEITNDDE